MSSKEIEFEDSSNSIKEVLMRPATKNSSEFDRVERSSRSQAYAILKKHVQGYKRNTDFVRQEIFNLVLYSALLIGFSFTSVETTHDPVFFSSETLTTDSLNAYAMDQPCQKYSGFQGPPCYIAFSDSTLGCTTELEEVISSMKICQQGANQSVRMSLVYGKKITRKSTPEYKFNNDENSDTNA